MKRDVAAKKRKVATSHPPAGAEAGAAQSAAVPPKDDREARGKAAHAEDMNAAQPKEFNKAAFVKAVQDAIAARAPKNLDEADKFGDSGKAEEVKTEVQDQVGAGKDASAKDIADTTAQTPQPAPDTKPVVPLAPDAPPAQPAAPNPAQATPDRLPPSATDMSAGPEQVDQQMADAQVTEPQLARSNEPAFTDALTEKKALEQHSATAPEKLRNSEGKELAQVKQTAATQGSQTMAAMAASRGATGQQVGAGKTSTKTSDEEKRTQVTALLQTVFDTTKCDVENILTGLDKKVDDQFTKGEKDARDRFTREHKDGMAAYKKKRYAGPDGWGRWIADRFRSLPKDADRIYEQARDHYLTAMNQVITDVAGTVETELRRAKDRIAEGRTQLRDAVRKLPGDLRAIGQQAAEDFTGKFDDLTDTVNTKGTELVDTLATRYTNAVTEIDKQIETEKERNKSWLDKAKDKVGDAVKTILNLKNMLMGVLRKAVTAIKAIIADPIGFLKNLVSAVGGGLKLFMKNIGKHLQGGLFAWLLGTATTAGLQIPPKFDIAGIVMMLASLIGLTWPNIRARIARKVPDQALTAAETAVPLVMHAKERGISGMWDDLKTRIGDLKKDLIDNLIKYLTPTIIIAGITWILSLLNPASAFVRACKMIIDIVQFIINQGAQIIEFVNSVLDAIIAISRGGTGGVPALVERALARSIPVLIGALAALLGIGGIAAKVRQIFHQLTRPVNRAVDWVIDKIIKLVKKLWAKLKSRFDKKPGDKGKGGTPQERLRLAVTEAEALTTSGKRLRPILSTRLALIKRKYRLAELRTTRADRSFAWTIHAKANPEAEFKVYSVPDGRDVLRGEISKAIDNIKGKLSIETVKGTVDRLPAVTNLKSDIRLVWEPMNDEVWVLFLKISGKEKDPTPIGYLHQRHVYKPKGRVGVQTVYGDPSGRQQQEYVEDAIGQKVPRCIIRNLTLAEVRTVRADKGIPRREGVLSITELQHVTGKGKRASRKAEKRAKKGARRGEVAPKSKWISGTTVPSGDVKLPDGKLFGDVGDRAEIDLAFVPKENIRNLTTPEGQWAWLRDEKGVLQEQAVKDVVRTQEILIIGAIPSNAVKMLSGKTINEARRQYVKKMKALYPDEHPGILHVNIRQGALFVEIR